MKSLTISGTKRVDLSKQALHKLRASGNVPCVLYGGKEQVHFSAFELAFRGLVYTPEVHTVNLDVDGAQYQAVLQDIQMHPVTDKIRHIDFLQIFPDKNVTIGIPVKVTGNSEGVKQGGKLIQKIKKLMVRALPAHLPDSIEVKVEKLGIGDSVRVGDIKIDNLTLLDSPNNVVVGVRVTRNIVEETPAAAAATPAAAAAAPAAGAAAKPAAGAAAAKPADKGAKK